MRASTTNEPFGRSVGRPSELGFKKEIGGGTFLLARLLQHLSRSCWASRPASWPGKKSSGARAKRRRQRIWPLPAGRANENRTPSCACLAFCSWHLCACACMCLVGTCRSKKQWRASKRASGPRDNGLGPSAPSGRKWPRWTCRPRKVLTPPHWALLVVRSIGHEMVALRGRARAASLLVAQCCIN